MKAQLVDIDNLEIIGTFTSVEEADSYGATETNATYDVVATVEDLSRYSHSALVRLFNNQRSDCQPIKKFRDVKTAIDRTHALLKSLDIQPKKIKKSSKKKTVKKTVKKKVVKKTPKKKIVKKKNNAAVEDKISAEDKPAAHIFRECIIANFNKDKTLRIVRKYYPDVPDGYYSWYKNDCIKKGLV